METIKVGQQNWMKTNLNTDRFNNGDLILEADTNEKWIEALQKKEPVWCHYQNHSEYGTKYGKIYNVYAFYDPRGLAPDGFSMPTQKDISAFYKGFFAKLFDLRTSNTDEFQKGGIRTGDGTFKYIDELGFYFCGNEKQSLSGFAVPNGIKIETQNGYYLGLKDNGRYIKCIKK